MTDQINTAQPEITPAPAPTTPAAPPVQPPAPAAQVAAVAPQPPIENEGEDTEAIRDPMAKMKAEVEKSMRLLKKYEARVKELEAQTPTIPPELDARLKQLESEAQAAKQHAESEHLQRIRSEALVKAGLPPEAAQYLTATDEAAIATQVDGLQKLFPQAAPRGRVGNAAAGADTSQAQMLANYTGSGVDPWDAMKG